MIGNKKLAVIIQCRLSSTRLPGKALMDLGGKTVFEWTLDSMSKVKADKYIVATDDASYPVLAPLAEKHGWKIMAGPLEDVLERFCMAIKKFGCSCVLRATADNPFLFYEAAQALSDEFFKQDKIAHCDYMTWTGLPHGCGVEIFWADSLLKAAQETKDPYDHEHVGPALYNHKDRFTSLFYKAPARFYFPDYRTTIDTFCDYRKALAVVNCISGGTAPSEPYTTEQIISAVSNPDVCDTVLLYPCTKKGCGTGHLRRCLKTAVKSGAFVYIPENPELEETDSLIKEFKSEGLKDYQIARKFPEKNEYNLIVADAFCLDEETASKLSQVAIFCAIDEGGNHTDYCDVLFDILPGYRLDRTANLQDPSFIERPVSVRSERPSVIKKILVCCGGEDPAGLVEPASAFFRNSFPDAEVTAIVPAEKLRNPEFNPVSGINYREPVKDLKERLSEYDLIVTHYGFTAFEALSAGCAVVLLSTTKLHENLARKYGFVCLDRKDLENPDSARLVKDMEKLFPKVIDAEKTKSLPEKIKYLSHGRRYACPVCGEHSPDNEIIARIEERTFRRCNKCSMIYISWNNAVPMKYEKEYFAEQYKNQYGRTYLEDFDSIKKTGLRRIQEIQSALRLKDKGSAKVLDIGCAYGPFLSAANEKGWLPYGTDIAPDAVDYVRSKLLFPAVVSKFPDFNPMSEFGLNQFEAVTMWYVIEHFSDLKSVLEKISLLVKKGGIFAFSTPSAEGVSGRKNRNSFFETSPSDHFTIWEPSKVSKILKPFGFEVVKIVSTGHHPERFPKVRDSNAGKDDFMFKYYGFLSRTLKLGDTFEVYCRKI